MTGVEGITLNLSNGECNAGVLVDQSGSRPRINLFELKENTGPILTENIFEAAPLIHEKYFPNLSINDIEWTITNGYQRSPLDFQEVDGRLVRTTYEHGYVNGTMRYDTLDTYNQALNSPEGFEHVTTSGRGFYKASPETFLAIPAAHHPNGVYYMRTEYSGRPDSRYELVFADPEKFINDWRINELGTNPARSPDAYLFNSSPSQALEHMDWAQRPGHSGVHEVGQVNYNRGQISFVNGRHRSANLAALGAAFIPVEIERENLDAFRSRYEYGRLTEPHIPTPPPINQDQRTSQLVESNPRLKIPTDAEISRMVGDVPVMSVRPEDLPHFRPTFYEGYNSAEIDSRIGAAYDRIKTFCPAWDGQHGDLGMIGTNSDAAVLTWSTNGRPNMFVLLRPSEQLDQKNRLSSFASVSPEDVAFTIPKQAEDFISTYHEIGHMHANVNLGGHSWSRFESELHADSYGLQHYLDAGGDIDVVRAYIQERSLASFLGQTSAYRIGPILEERFLSDQPIRYDNPADTRSSRLQAWKEYGELIARTSDRAAGYNALAHYSSADIQNALLLMDQNRYHEIPDQNLLRALDDAEFVKRDPHSIWGTNRRAAFDALHDVTLSENIDPHTARAGRSVLQAAGRFTPTLLSERIATYRQVHIDNPTDHSRRNIDVSETLPQRVKPGNATRTQQDWSNVGSNSNAPSPTANTLNSRFTNASRVGASSYGLVMGGMNTYHSYQAEDTGGIIIGAGDLTVSAADTGLDIAQIRGASISRGVLGTAAKANILLTVADVGYQVYREDDNFIDEDGSVGHKGERLVAGTMTAGAGLGAGLLLGGSGFMGAAAGGTIITGAAAVAAPVVVAGVAVYGTAKATEIAIETRRIYERMDEQVNEMTAAGRFQEDEADKPSLANYKQCLFSSMRFSHRIRDNHINGGVERNGSNRITNLKEIDFSDPENLAEFERMLNLEIRNQKKIIKDNSSILPRWARSGDSVMRQETAKTDLKMLESAKEEIAMYRQELREWEANSQKRTQTQLSSNNSNFDDSPIGPRGRLVGAWNGEDAIDRPTYVVTPSFLPSRDM